MAAGKQGIMEQVEQAISPDRAFLKFAVESLMAQLHAIQKESSGVKLADDPECLHRMRVASRRLRTRLAIFRECLPEGRAMFYRKRVRTLTRALGEARDADVQMIHLSEFMEGLETRRQREGIKRLLLRLSQKRAKYQSSVVKAVTRMDEGRVFAEMEETFRSILGTLAFEKPAEYSDYAFRLASSEIRAQLNELLSFEMYVNDPSRSAELHQMRIAAKHLRYAMESFEPLFRIKLKKPIKTAKLIQEILGDIHDCDVWLYYLPVFLEDETSLALEYSGNARIISRIRPGIGLLQKERDEFRIKRYAEFRQAWEDSSEVWQALSDFLNSDHKIMRAAKTVTGDTE
jgi:CHAD domain-containing protein